MPDASNDIGSGSSVIGWGISSFPSGFTEVDGDGNVLTDIRFTDGDTIYRAIKVDATQVNLQLLRQTAGWTGSTIPPPPAGPPGPAAGGVTLNKAVLGMAASPDGWGYWLVGVRRRVFSYGDAGFYGSAGGTPLNKPWWAWRLLPMGAGTGWSPPTAGSSLSATPASTAPRVAPRSTARSWVWPPPPTGVGTGWSPPTAASSASATPASTARRAAPSSTSRSWAWPPPPTAVGTGWSPPTAASSASATPASTAPRAAPSSTNRSSAWRRARRRRLLAGRLRRRHLQLRRRRLLRLRGRHHLNKPIVGMAATPRRRVLAGRLRRRYLQLRGRRLLRLGGGRLSRRRWRVVQSNLATPRLELTRRLDRRHEGCSPQVRRGGADQHLGRRLVTPCPYSDP